MWCYTTKNATTYLLSFNLLWNKVSCSLICLLEDKLRICFIQIEEAVGCGLKHTGICLDMSCWKVDGKSRQGLGCTCIYMLKLGSASFKELDAVVPTQPVLGPPVMTEHYLVLELHQYLAVFSLTICNYYLSFSMVFAFFWLKLCTLWVFRFQVQKIRLYKEVRSCCQSNNCSWTWYLCPSLPFI